MKRRLISFLPLFVVLSICESDCAAARAAIQYTVTDLGGLFDDQTSAAFSVNSTGQVTGYALTQTSQDVFLWSPTTSNGTHGSLTDLGSLGGGSAVGFGINSSGEVVGESYADASGYYHAFLWTPLIPNGAAGTMDDLGTFGANSSASALGINSVGHIVITANSGAYLYDGTAHSLGAFSASAINNSGQITGSKSIGAGQFHALLWTPTVPNGTSGAMVDLGTPGGSSGSSYGNAINTAGAIVGEADTAAADQAFLWTPTMPNGTAGTMIGLGTLGGSISNAFGINDSGTVVGYSTLPGNSVQHAIMYSSASGLVDLNTLIDPATGWRLTNAEGINNAGQIVGYGVNADDLTHAF